MPNKTFNNLSSEKQEIVIEAALKEFTTHDYKSASLNQIINDIGIAKGSFYRYFDSKNDLYLYLIDFCLDKKFKYVTKRINEATEDFFESFKNIMYTYLKFNMEYQTYAVFLLKAFINNDITRDDFLFLKNGREKLMDIIIKYQDKGVLSKEYSVEFIFYCITQILLGSPNYIKEFCGVKKCEIILGDKLDHDKLDNDKIKFVFDQFISFFKNGFSGSTNSR